MGDCEAIWIRKVERKIGERDKLRKRVELLTCEI